MNATQQKVLDEARFYLNFMRKHNLRIPKVPTEYFETVNGKLVSLYDPDPYVTEEEYISHIQRQLDYLS